MAQAFIGLAGVELAQAGMESTLESREITPGRMEGVFQRIEVTL